MPKQRPETEKAKAENLLKHLEKNRFNQSEVARQRGVNQTTINEQFNRKPTQDALNRYLDSKKTAKKVAKRLDEGLDSTKVIGYLHQYKKEENGKVEKAKPDEVVSNEFITVEDMHARHKYLTTYMQATGKIKNNDKDTHIHLHLTVEEKNARISRLTEFYQN